jgi:hypothetical protein
VVSERVRDVPERVPLIVPVTLRLPDTMRFFDIVIPPATTNEDWDVLVRFRFPELSQYCTVVSPNGPDVVRANVVAPRAFKFFPIDHTLPAVPV